MVKCHLTDKFSCLLLVQKKAGICIGFKLALEDKTVFLYTYTAFISALFMLFPAFPLLSVHKTNPAPLDIEKPGNKVYHLFPYLIAESFRGEIDNTSIVAVQINRNRKVIEVPVIDTAGSTVCIFHPASGIKAVGFEDFSKILF